MLLPLLVLCFSVAVSNHGTKLSVLGLDKHTYTDLLVKVNEWVTDVKQDDSSIKQHNAPQIDVNHVPEDVYQLRVKGKENKQCEGQRHQIVYYDLTILLVLCIVSS